jgi:hypothetical protein
MGTEVKANVPNSKPNCTQIKIALNATARMAAK